MSDKNVLNFPQKPQEINIDSEIPQGFSEFYTALQQAVGYAFMSVAPYKDRHPALEQCFGELLRYMELTTMYMDRYVLYVKNPHLLQKPESKDAQTEKAD